MKKPLSHIKPSPINEEIYSPTDLSDLELSLKQNGQLEPIVINSDGNINVLDVVLIVNLILGV